MRRPTFPPATATLEPDRRSLIRPLASIRPSPPFLNRHRQSGGALPPWRTEHALPPKHRQRPKAATGATAPFTKGLADWKPLLPDLRASPAYARGRWPPPSTPLGSRQREKSRGSVAITRNPLNLLELAATVLSKNATVLSDSATPCALTAAPSFSSFFFKIKEKEKKSRENKSLTRATVLTSCLFFGPRNSCRATPKTVAFF